MSAIICNPNFEVRRPGAALVGDGLPSRRYVTYEVHDNLGWAKAAPGRRTPKVYPPAMNGRD
ncbi:MAG: hypothetical protein AABN95_00785 [Acidobacteriota bacterium]